MSLERTQILVPSARFTGCQPIAIAVTSAAISSSIAIAAKYCGQHIIESYTHGTVTLHVHFFMFIARPSGALGSASEQRCCCKLGCGPAHQKQTRKVASQDRPLARQVQHCERLMTVPGAALRLLSGSVRARGTAATDERAPLECLASPCVRCNRIPCV